MDAVAASLQLGKQGAGVKSLSPTAVATRNAADTALVTMEVATPTAAAHATTKAYVDALLNGLVWKEPARAVATSNIATLSGTAVIDGVALAAGDRVLLSAQTTATDNGIWEVQTGAWTRPADFANGSSAQANALFITEGTANADTAWVCTTDAPNDIVGTDALTFVQFSSVTPGVVTIADAAAVPAGGSSLIASGTGPTATLNVLDDSARISISLAAGVITLDIVAASITTAFIANQAVTAAKLAPNASLIRATFTVTFSDQGTTVTGPTLLANSRVVSSEVNVTVAFNDSASPTTIDVQVNAVSIQGTALNDPTIIDVYECTGINEDNAAAVTVEAVLGGGTANTAGSAEITVYYYVTA